MSAIIKIIIALLMGAVSIVTYWCSREYNPVTEQNQPVTLSVNQEIALGLQAAPQLAAQYGGLHTPGAETARIKAIGSKLVKNTKAGATPYQFEFHLLADEQTQNAFALPGGQVFITAGLANALQTDGEMAGVLAHEIGHVVARHAAEQLANAQLTEALTGAAAIAMYDPDNQATAAGSIAAALVTELVSLNFSREDELHADQLAVRFMAEAGYDPRALINVMKVLASASGGGSTAEFFQTHPNPANRTDRIRVAIKKQFGSKFPEGLTP